MTPQGTPERVKVELTRDDLSALFDAVDYELGNVDLFPIRRQELESVASKLRAALKGDENQ